MKQLITTKKCYGRLCSDEYRKASSSEFEIFGWNRPVWLLTWYKNDDNYYKKINSNFNNCNFYSVAGNNNKTKVPIVCPKCGSMIALIDNGSKVGCSKYPQCNYVVWKDN